MNVRHDARPMQPPETDFARIEREEAIIDQGLADIRAGRGIEYEDVKAWLDLVEHNMNAPLPAPRTGLVNR